MSRRLIAIPFAAALVAAPNVAMANEQGAAAGAVTGAVAGALIGGPVEGKTCVILDDMISTAGSVVGAAHIAKQFGARAVYACVTHGILCGPAIDRLREAPLTKVVITDTIPLSKERHLPNIHVLSVAPLPADAIKRIHANESVSVLFE